MDSSGDLSDEHNIIFIAGTMNWKDVFENVCRFDQQYWEPRTYRVTFIFLL